MTSPGLKSGMKNAVELLATASGISRWKRRRRILSGGSVILAYHQVSDQVQHPGHAAEMIVGVREFAAQADHLARGGRVVTLDDASAAALNPAPGPPKQAITFDDGYAGVYESAYPILIERGLRFAVFVTTNIVGTKDRLPGEARFQGVCYSKLSWDQIGRMAESGATIGAHGATHRRLAALSRQEAIDEIAGSKEAIEKRLGRPVTHFAYPYGGPGDFTEETESLVELAGYKLCYLCAGAARRPESPYRIDRFPVWRGMLGVAFRNLCSGGDTAGSMTALSRRLRGRASSPGEGKGTD